MHFAPPIVTPIAKFLSLLSVLPQVLSYVVVAAGLNQGSSNTGNYSSSTKLDRMTS